MSGNARRTNIPIYSKKERNSIFLALLVVPILVLLFKTKTTDVEISKYLFQHLLLFFLAVLFTYMKCGVQRM